VHRDYGLGRSRSALADAVPRAGSCDTAAAAAVSAQLKADETKMKQVVHRADVMTHLLELIKIEEAKLAEMDRRNLEKEEHTTLPENNA
jgi:hypothetical protein